MTTITLSPEVEEAIAREAQKQGITPEGLAVESLRKLFASPVSTRGNGSQTLADFLRPYVGSIDGTSEALSEKTGERFTAGLLERQRRGKA